MGSDVWVWNPYYGCPSFTLCCWDSNVTLVDEDTNSIQWSPACPSPGFDIFSIYRTHIWVFSGVFEMRAQQQALPETSQRGKVLARQPPPLFLSDTFQHDGTFVPAAYFLIILPPLSAHDCNITPLQWRGPPPPLSLKTSLPLIWLRGSKWGWAQHCWKHCVTRRGFPLCTSLNNIKSVAKTWDLLRGANWIQWPGWTRMK